MRYSALKIALVAILSLALVCAPHLFTQMGSAQTPGPTPCGTSDNAAKNNIKYAMYFMSKPQDGGECAMTVKDGRIVPSASVTNPGMTCPDMAAWKVFAEAIKQQFWRNWAADQETWPGVGCPNGDKKCAATQPLPLCATGTKPDSPAAKQCCVPGNRNNPGYKDGDGYPFKYCPYFPGDNITDGSAPLRRGGLPSKAHLPGFALAPEMKAALIAEEPGRIIRQSMSEIVFRNKPMFDYIFTNNLYNQEGIIDVYNRNNNNISSKGTSGAPYRIENRLQAISEIDLPAAAIMIKSDWINKAVADKVGLKEDPNNPYIKMNILTPQTDNNGTILTPGEHWLIAIHVSSKDTPNWVWATFEHVNNPGRCDFTGCNDSYGYTSSDTVLSGQSMNYTMPFIKCDDLPIAGYVFDTAKQYPGGKINSKPGGLDSIFRGLGIGTGTSDITSLNPTPADKAWRSYRLKGTQVNFTDSMGRATRLGNSVTEGGFVSSSSCISCHARAGTNGNGTLPPVLGVFVNQTSESGYLESYNGTPNPDWYHHSGQPPRVDTLQTDFIWGFLNANLIKPSPGLKAPPPQIRQRREP